MGLRHWRYFLAVGEALNFSKGPTQLCVAQTARSRRVQVLEDEIGVDLLKRSLRGTTLTADGKLFLQEVRALARGEPGELHVASAPSPGKTKSGQ